MLGHELRKLIVVICIPPPNCFMLFMLMPVDVLERDEWIQQHNSLTTPVSGTMFC